MKYIKCAKEQISRKIEERILERTFKIKEEVAYIRQDFMEVFRKRGIKARTYKGSTLAKNLEEIENRCRSRKKRIDVEANRVRHGTRNGRTNVKERVTSKNRINKEDEEELK